MKIEFDTDDVCLDGRLELARYPSFTKDGFHLIRRSGERVVGGIAMTWKELEELAANSKDIQAATRGHSGAVPTGSEKKV